MGDRRPWRTQPSRDARTLASAYEAFYIRPMNAENLSQLANAIMTQAGITPACGPFTPQVAWAAHQRANERAAAGTILKKLLDVEEQFGPGSAEEAVVQTIINCGPVPLEVYPIAPAVWEHLGFELYRNGDGSHGAHIPMSQRSKKAVRVAPEA